MKFLTTLLFPIFLVACSSTVKTPDNVIGTTFPTVVGTNLQDKSVTLPRDFLGKNTIVLIGYLQRAQFDIDRWILGILQADINAQIVEVPTIAGMMPQMVQEYINNGMRSGIPKEDWADVVTVYKDADKIVTAFGNERPQSALALVLGKKGEVLWSSNRGYSASQVLEVKKLLQRAP